MECKKDKQTAFDADDQLQAVAGIVHCFNRCAPVFDRKYQSYTDFGYRLNFAADSVKLAVQTISQD